jgi:hypothetical protein
MIKKEERLCKSDCIYFPPVGEFEFLVNKNGVKRKINSKPYRCLYDNKIIDWHKICTNCTTLTKEVKENEC